MRCRVVHPSAEAGGGGDDTAGVASESAYDIGLVRQGNLGMEGASAGDHVSEAN